MGQFEKEPGRYCFEEPGVAVFHWIFKWRSEHRAQSSLSLRSLLVSKILRGHTSSLEATRDVSNDHAVNAAAVASAKRSIQLSTQNVPLGTLFSRFCGENTKCPRSTKPLRSTSGKIPVSIAISLITYRISTFSGLRFRQLFLILPTTVRRHGSTISFFFCR